MGLFVNTNASSLNAQRNLFNSSQSLSTSFERLSSGFRINSASDDAAGLQITDRLTSQIQGLDQGARNANDGISLAQTAEGALGEITTSLQRIRTLAVQSQNGINTAEDREALDQEVTALKDEITRIAEKTSFGGQEILDGSFSASFLVGAQNGESIDVDLTTTRTTSGVAGFTSTNLSIEPLDVKNESNAALMLDEVDKAIKDIGKERGALGAVQNRFQSTIRNLSNISENVSAARGRIRDTDFASETAELTRNQIVQQASLTILSQANQRPQAALSLLG
jgi:flagellin